MAATSVSWKGPSTMAKPLKTPTGSPRPHNLQPPSEQQVEPMPSSGHRERDRDVASGPGASAPPQAAPPSPFDNLPSLWDDEEDEEITVVGEMPEAIKALRRGYRKKTPPPIVDDRPDIEIHYEQDVDQLLVEELLEDGPVDPTRRITVVGHCATDCGRRRQVNQDAALVMPHHQVFVIADGMGGHVGGEVASGLAVDTVEDAMKRQAFEGEPHMLWPELGDEMARTLEMANGRIFEEANTQELTGMGTTMTALRFSLNRQRAYIAHVGDSRCYRIRRGAIQQVTSDHTIANLMGVEGPIGAQLSRAVGVELTVEVDLLVDVPEVGDRYLLCTDGLNKMLSDDSILSIVLEHRNLVRAVEALIDTANFYGGRDNIGIVLVDVFAAAGSV